MILEILRLEICFAILIPRLEKEQNPCSAGGFMMVLYFRLSRPGWASYLGMPVNEPCPFQQLPQGVGLVSCPRRAHPSGGRGGQRGCREALPPRRPREPGEEGLHGPQPRNQSWKLRSRSTPSISLVCFGQAVTLGKESAPIGRLGS